MFFFFFFLFFFFAAVVVSRDTKKKKTFVRTLPKETSNEDERSSSLDLQTWFAGF